MSRCFLNKPHKHELNSRPLSFLTLLCPQTLSFSLSHTNPISLISFLTLFSFHPWPAKNDINVWHCNFSSIPASLLILGFAHLVFSLSLSFILLLLLTDIHMTICIQVKWECVVYHFKTLRTPSHKYISIPLSSDKTSAALSSFFSSLSFSLSLSLSLSGEAVSHNAFHSRQTHFKYSSDFHYKPTARTQSCAWEKAENWALWCRPPSLYVCLS